MIDPQQEQTAEHAAPKIEKLYMENTLLRVFGILFCHDAKHARMRAEKIELNRGDTHKAITVRLDSEYRQPGPFAHKIAVAIIKKLSNYGRPIQPQVSFSQRELLRLVGRNGIGGKDSDELVFALKQIRYTHIIAHFKKDDRFVEHDFSIFDQVLIERRESHPDPVVACSIVLAEPIITSLQDRHFTCLNHSLMQQLGTIGQALYMRLFFHFANLYDGHHKTRLTFPKRYDDISAEWLGGLTVHKHRSLIERDQLGPHLRQLVQLRFLASYHIAKASRGDGFIVTFRPGHTFFADYERFYRHRSQGEIQFDFHRDQREVGEPLKVAYLFIEKRTGKPMKDIPYVSSKDVETAKGLLARVRFEEIPDFLDYALTEAKKTRFDIQTLGAMKQYLNGYLESRRHRAATKGTQAARQIHERETQERMTYDRFRRTAADDLFAILPAAEKAMIEGLARSKAPTGARDNGSIAEIVFGIARARTTADRHPDKIPTFEQWTTRRASQTALH